MFIQGVEAVDGDVVEDVEEGQFLVKHPVQEVPREVPKVQGTRATHIALPGVDS